MLCAMGNELSELAEAEPTRVVGEQGFLLDLSSKRNSALWKKLVENETATDDDDVNGLHSDKSEDVDRYSGCQVPC